jgi:hypothetical protein
VVLTIKAPEKTVLNVKVLLDVKGLFKLRLIFVLGVSNLCIFLVDNAWLGGECI